MAQTWIEQLTALNKPLHQKDLTNQFNSICEVTEYDYAKAEERACFFGVPKKSGLWRTRPGMTRGEGYTMPVILRQDLDEWKKSKPTQDPNQDWIRKHEVSIPIREQALKWNDRVGGIRVADEDIVYDYNEETREGTGAKWR
ncbi:hypothetical protein [Neosynechococcus sphagnicola]|uniref:hypothetical protein n=1 Tax=Neosynechococcus sphagnicola TaxID=1501145 RepID=UPI0019552395|nr:hypothetical protein [Neosynechococcus sphagnicola]